MTESEWLASDDPAAMLGEMQQYHPRGPISNRKLRLFACACCRVIWHKLDEGGREAVEVAEAFADGTANKLIPSEDIVSLLDAGAAARAITRWAARGGDPARECPPALQAALLRDIVGNPFRPVRPSEIYLPPGTRLAKRRPVIALANRIYDDRDFGLCPILADALEDAGCTEEELLRHLRNEEPALVYDPLWRAPRDCMVMNEDLECVGCGAKLRGLIRCVSSPPPNPSGWRPLRGPHCRGCWAIDLVLGKE